LLAEVVLAFMFGHYSSAPSIEEQTKPKTSARWEAALRVAPWLLFTLVFLGTFVLLHDAWTGDFLGFLPDTMRRSVESWLDIPPPA